MVGAPRRERRVHLLLPGRQSGLAREGKHGETAALKRVTKKTTTTYDNIPHAERSNGVLRAGGTCGPGVTGGEYVGCLRVFVCVMR